MIKSPRQKEVGLTGDLDLNMQHTPILYCSSVWGCSSGTELHKLQKLQNRAIRIMTDSPFDFPSKLLLSNL